MDFLYIWEDAEARYMFSYCLITAIPLLLIAFGFGYGLADRKGR